jgi:hypothetical protein
VSYQDVGFRARLTGNWRDDDPQERADITFSIECSRVVKSPVEIGSGVTLPSFAELEIEQGLVVASGKPVFLVNNDMTSPGDPDALTYVSIIRFVATRLDDGAAGQAAANTGEQTLINMAIIELAGDKDELDGLDLDKIVPRDATAEQVTQALSKFGKPEILARPSILATWPGTARVEIGEQIPFVSEFKPGPDGAMTPSVDYKQAGITLDITGHWLEEVSPPQGVITLNLEQCSVRPSGVVTGQPKVALPIFTERSLCRVAVVRSGAPIWVLNESFGSSDNAGKQTRVLVRLSAQPLDERVQADQACSEASANRDPAATQLAASRIE